EREGVVERGGRDREPRRARDRALHADRRQHDPLSGHGERSGGLHETVDDRVRLESAEGRTARSGVPRRQSGPAAPEGSQGRGAQETRELMKGIRVAGVVVVLMALVAIRAAAHHSFSAEYDANKPIKLTGKLIEIEVSNPTAW